MSRIPLVWVNGERAAAALHLSALDRGFTLADGLFETMRVSNGVVFRPGAHLGRLHAAARRLGLGLPANLRQLVEDAARVAAAQGMLEAGLRLTVTRGIALPGILIPEAPVPTVVVVVTERAPVPDSPGAGLTARIVSGRRNEYAMTAGMKTLSYTDSVLALAEARAAGADEALMLDTAGHLSEASASNLFLLLDGVLHTPPLSCAALPGITRAVVLELADSLGIVADERALAPEDLFAAEEAFLTSSLRGIVSLRAVDGSPIGDGTRGTTTDRIAREYRALIEEECAAWPSVAG